MKRPPRFLFIALTVGAVCAAAFSAFVLMVVHSIPTAAERRQSASLKQYVVGRVAIEGKSRTNPDEPPVYCSPRRNSLGLTVYGITNADQQDAILSAVREWQTTNRNMAKLSVRFYERENWRWSTNHQDGSAIGQRLPEVLLREASVVVSKDPPR
jgi:hypothetical protein